MSSLKLALALLVIILVCCVAGVTLLRGEQAWKVIFSTVWFNGVLAALIINVGFCFFRRIWGMRITVISFGMILFHLSFISVFAGVIYNSLFYFRGIMRLTEGETLSRGNMDSYDVADMGRYFDPSRLKGEVTLVRMHRDYKVGGADKRAAYEIEVGDRQTRTRGIIYITNKLVYDGFQYFNDREGYSLLTILFDRAGGEIYGAHFALQSLKQKDNAYLYTTGSREGPGSYPFPQEPVHPLYALQVAYTPMPLADRTGDVRFQVWPLVHGKQGERRLADISVPVGQKIRVADHYLSVTEVRYWVAMSVRYEPGKPIVLVSLWIGLCGMIMTFIGRMMKSRNQEPGARRQEIR